jgi:zinc transport system substrate-binding protein
MATLTESEHDTSGCFSGLARWWLLLSALAPLIWPSVLPAAPSVVASIGPVHSLAAAVMGNLGEPRQIVRGYGSPHAYQMRPSDAAALRDADLILWIGPALETFLLRPLEGRQDDTRVVQLSTLEGLRLLPNRSAGVLHADDRSNAHDEHAGFDAHIWLSPFNAKVIAAAIAAELSAIDPENAVGYRQNADHLMRRIDAMETRIASRLAPVRAIPFVMFHDAFQYFEESFELNAVGSVTLSPDHMPSARRIHALRKAIATSGARCVFREPQFESALMQVLLEDTDARSGVLDPLGTDIAPGPDGYFSLMNENADALVACLNP